MADNLLIETASRSDAGQEEAMNTTEMLLMVAGIILLIQFLSGRRRIA